MHTIYHHAVEHEGRTISVRFDLSKVVAIDGPYHDCAGVYFEGVRDPLVILILTEEHYQKLISAWEQCNQNLHSYNIHGRIN